MHPCKASKDRSQSFAKASAALGPAYVFEDGATYSYLSGHKLLPDVFEEGFNMAGSPMPRHFRDAGGMFVHFSAERQWDAMGRNDDDDDDGDDDNDGDGDGAVSDDNDGDDDACADEAG